MTEKRKKRKKKEKKKKEKRKGERFETTILQLGFCSKRKCETK